MAGALIVNGVDTRSEYGFVLGRDMSGWRDGLNLRRPDRQVPDAYGHAPLSDRFSAGTRTIRVTGHQRAPDINTLQERKRKFRAHVQSGMLEVEFSDDADRYFEAEARRFTVQGIGPQITQDAHRVVIELTCLTPLVYRKQADVVSLGTSFTEIPTGTGPGTGTVTIVGPVVAPTITYRSYTGSKSREIRLSTSLSSSERRVIDLVDQTIKDAADNGHIDELDGGDFFRVDGEDAAGEDGPYPAIKVEPSPGSCSYEGKRSWI